MDIRISLHQLLDRLPPESLGTAEQFLRFLQAGTSPKKSTGRAFAPRYPTVALPTTALDALVGVMPAIGGDALQDSESLYDGN
jgi:hypothetical protein